mmetsp:Transcript_5884/g.10232  ORF Transcript_5884/g.10232 Transcript_5884/m.10232 type:complete len:188 (-) Transcript_5884:205-768(-)|eukprot:CAMPEP_0119105936 /NCGR_PEP_ID=MMETSP1180-20130426/3764_1 /TAXON_ID=3052 ORGANISM="Chlamydomonas cf sp, Strain CCMP681" /NCGR_SAMPLE_ID=MMETSP1180 /ASSEMBLY_ACC=CAM_ASM_000741 /LENGTH=187 /DNA_ID=CAMNT_0007091121 /DNA_START=91 /DNA_END=654 /DNA_ORIENTATION=+
MASAPPPEEPQISATFPAPPPFYKLYGADSQLPAGVAPPGPPAPPSGSFQLFDRMFSLDEPLVPTTANYMIEGGPDGTVDVKGQLMSLSQEVLPLYLELLRTLIEAPEEHSGALQRVASVMSAMQHLTNMIRPAQAWATLEHLLRHEVADKEEALSKLRTQVLDLDRLLLQAGQELASTVPPSDQPM